MIEAERRGKQRWREWNGKMENREERSRCRLSPLVSAVASRMSDACQWTGQRTLSSPSCIYSPLCLEGPGSRRQRWSPVSAHADSCIVPSQGKRHVVPNNWAPLTTLPTEDKGDTLLKALCEATCIIEHYIMFTVCSLCANKCGWSGG